MVVVHMKLGLAGGVLVVVIVVVIEEFGKLMENGLLHVPKGQAQNAQAQMFSDPNMAMDMMKKNLSMIIPQPGNLKNVCENIQECKAEERSEERKEKQSL
ncbi:hypothetical protein IFM89_023819 [Coptis chinensis]|uniref:Uncharacterized protein n=1 Tax=Coptis chinensis TaxID=261450 RepID=A0A835LMK0_9MAGN|nr:hypothetical protein IFM89_023819 [Coptis chinensis]